MRDREEYQVERLLCGHEGVCYKMTTTTTTNGSPLVFMNTSSKFLSSEVIVGSIRTTFALSQSIELSSMDWHEGGSTDG
jgi:hypothetical protein